PADDGAREPDPEARRAPADRPLAADATAGAPLGRDRPRLSGLAVQRPEAPRHGSGERRPTRPARSRPRGVLDAAALGRRGFGALPPRRPRPELRLRDR